MRIQSFGVFLIIVGFGLTYSPNANAVSNRHGDEVHAVEIPRFLGENATLQRNQSNTSMWHEFISEHGPYHAIWNEYTERPHRAYGPPIPSTEGQMTDAENTARSFINDHPELFNVGQSDLVLVHKALVRESIYLTFQQLYKGIPVEETYVQVRLNEAGIWCFGSDAYADIPVDLTPSVGQNEAIDASLQGLMITSGEVESRNERLVILPYVVDDGVDFALAYRVELERIEPAGRWTAWINANTGELLRRISHVRSQEVDGSVQINMLPQFYNDPWSTEACSNDEVTIQSQGMDYTDAAGYYSINVGAGSYTLHAELKGLWVDVTPQGGGDAQHNATVSTGQTHDWLWSIQNAGDDEVNAYYHTDYAHGWIKVLDPLFTGLDYQMPCEVNDTSYPAPDNAYWDGNGIHFGAGGSLFRDLALFSDVIYHEYFHGVTDKLYTGVSDPPSDIHEGMSDFFACTITDNPLLGDGGLYLSGQPYMRTCDNTLVYPDDLTGEGHFDGQILAGAWWDFRELEGAPVAEELAHFAKYGFPYSFPEYFWEALYYDDDDFNLFNGTPHSGSLFEAFGMHGIGPGPGVIFDHDPLWNTQVTSQPYNVEAMAYSMAYPVIPDSTRLFYSIDGGPYTVVQMIQFGDGLHYLGNIPAQSAGTLVRYFIRSADQNGNATTLPEQAPQEIYLFLVGPTQVVLGDDFEGPNTWTVNLLGDDDATTGIWELGDPVEVISDNGTRISPEDDHTLNPGINCWVTEIATPGATGGDDDVDGGKTSLYSPIFSTVGLVNPISSFFLYFSNDAGNNPGQDPFLVGVSNDGGSTWYEMASINTSREQFTLYQYALSDFLVQTSQMMIRFIAQDESPGSLVEATLDDFTVRAAAISPVDVSLQFTPVGGPIVIPASGGSFQYDVLLENSGAGTVSIDVWNEATLPNGSHFGPILSVADFNIPAGGQVSPTLTQNVPVQAPAGNYAFYGFTGDWSGAAVYDQTQFPFTKSGSSSTGFDEAGWWSSGNLDESTSLAETNFPVEYSLHPVYPNPFNPRTEISFVLPHAGLVKLAVYNAMGQKIATLLNRTVVAGEHSLIWDAADVASGLYLIRFEAGQVVRIRKALLMK